MGGPQGRLLQRPVSEKHSAVPAIPDSLRSVLDAGLAWLAFGNCMERPGLNCCCAVQPSLATLLAKPNMGMKDTIFASTNGQTRKLRSYFPDPTMDIDNKVRCLMSAGAVQTQEHAAICSLNVLAAQHALPMTPCSKAFMEHMLTCLLPVILPGDGCCQIPLGGADLLCACCS